MFKLSTVCVSVRVAALSLVAMAGTLNAAPSFTEKLITDVGWRVEFVESQYDAAADTTTFTYRLMASSQEKDLSHWVLALDESPIASQGCDLVKFGLDPTTGVSGWKCDDGQNAGSTQLYELTFSGHLGQDDTEYSVKGGTYYAVGDTTGPGEPIIDVQKFNLSGLAFLDANGNGLHENDEPVFANVMVLLSNGETQRTDDGGHYRFTELPRGYYEVSIQPETPAVMDDFNELLSGYYLPTTASLLSLELTSDISNQDFGFNTNVGALMDDFDSADPDGNGQTFAGTGKTIGFWKHQLTSAQKGKTKGVQVSAALVRDYLYSGTSSVKTMYIEPFAELPAAVPGAYDYGLTVLSSTSSDALALLKKQLFATELNYQAGWGLSSMALQGSLIAWAEYLAKYPDSFSRDELLQAKDICDLINNSGE
ncbi:MSCRAMM family adhesin SdrC [Shewanella sp. JM162201]|uniref:MSCRAMM family adhesin SdrC n=1 Tax=Shewanella jiangmenensis TaxID=2837387 RepID=A0ABS5V3U2_9GAMM|nr:MSCRAMM family adhesin SdrC [Shewanella jiangmenensis]MBT1445117.1 MSCRAMM family adhesin SdrC [Shewanella jiangmenensis]